MYHCRTFIRMTTLHDIVKKYFIWTKTRRNKWQNKKQSHSKSLRSAQFDKSCHPKKMARKLKKEKIKFWSWRLEKREREIAVANLINILRLYIMTLES